MVAKIVGLEAVFIIKEFVKAQKQYIRAIEQVESTTEKVSSGVNSSTKKIATSVDELFRSSKVLQEALSSRKGLDDLIEFEQELAIVFASLGKNVKVNIATFDRLAEKGATLSDALREASGQTSELGISQKLLGSAISATAAAITLSIKVVQKSVREYAAFTLSVRQVTLELGSSAQEASAWARAAEIAGVSSTVFNRALTGISRNILNLRLRQQEGTEASNNFSRALELLQIDVTGADDTFKSATEILSELQTKIQDLGAGAITTGTLLDVMGFSGRQMLPIMLNLELSIKTLEQRVRELGAAINENDKEAVTKWKIAIEELRLAKEGLGNLIGRFFTPLVTELTKRTTELINSFRLLIALITSNELTKLSNLLGLTKLSDSEKTRADFLTDLLGAETELTKTEQELAAARDKLAQETLLAARAEQQLLIQRKAVLDQIADLDRTFLERQADTQIRFNQRWEDIIADRFNNQITSVIKTAFRVQELQIRHREKLADIARKGTSKEKELRDDLNKKLERFDEDARLRREKLESAHRDRLFKIQNRFLDTIQDAARKNDAVAVVAAIRRKNRELRDEARKTSTDRRNLEKDLAVKRDRINEDAKKKSQDAKKAADDLVKKADLEFKRQLAALVRKNAQENTLLTIKYAKQKVDFDRDRRRAEADTQRWYDREKSALATQLRELGNATVAGVTNLGKTVAQATAAAIGTIGVSSIAAINKAAFGIINVASANIVQRTQQSIIDINRRNRPTRSGQTFRRGDGGVDLVTQPTTFKAGDKGRELHAFIPLRNTSTIKHQFGNLGIDFGGLPGGMNTSQVEAIVYDAMVRIAEGIKGK